MGASDFAIVQKAFIHASDISGQALSPAMAATWSSRVLQEFKAQHSQEVELGLPLTEMLVGLDDACKANRMQHGFTNFVLLPLYTALCEAFPQINVGAPPRHS